MAFRLRLPALTAKAREARAAREQTRRWDEKRAEFTQSAPLGAKHPFLRYSRHATIAAGLAAAAAIGALGYHGVERYREANAQAAVDADLARRAKDLQKENVPDSLFWAQIQRHSEAEIDNWKDDPEYPNPDFHERQKQALRFTPSDFRSLHALSQLLYGANPHSLEGYAQFIRPIAGVAYNYHEPLSVGEERKVWAARELYGFEGGGGIDYKIKCDQENTLRKLLEAKEHLAALRKLADHLNKGLDPIPRKISHDDHL